MGLVERRVAIVSSPAGMTDHPAAEGFIRLALYNRPLLDSAATPMSLA